MNLPDQKLQKLLEDVESINPRITNYWQATAIIESLGYTDRIIQKEFNFPDALSLGQYIYQHHCPSPPKKLPSSSKILARKIREEIQIFIEQFSRSFVYAVPLILILILEYLGLNDRNPSLPPQLSSLLTLATLGSLCASGGFVQMISRRGGFYIGLGEPFQARRVCLPILYLGTATSIVLGFAGLLFGFYRGAFDDGYLILAAIYYLLLSLLWMSIAVLCVRYRSGSSIALVGLSGLFLILNVGAKLGALEAQIIATLITFVAVITIVALFFWKKYPEQNIQSQVKLPRLSALVYLLSPYFFYGIGYFCFIFADRLVAGWAISPASGSIFAIDSGYQRGMDLALLNFLLIVPLVEYSSYKFIRFWYDRVKQSCQIQIRTFSKCLRRRYGSIIVLTELVFWLSTYLTSSALKPADWGMKELSQSLLGCLGYSFFAVAILNAILLFSLDRAMTVLKPLGMGLALDLTVGYFFTNIFDASHAVIGLVVGAFAFMVLSSRALFLAIDRPDYAYFFGGY